jgi:hypothetical protein
MARHGRLRAGVDEGKGAGAVRRFDHARAETGLADRRRLLVAGNRGDRDGGTEEAGISAAEIAVGVAHFRQQRARDAERVKQIVVPGEAPQVEQHRARGVGDIGCMQPAAGQPPQQERIDRAERDFPGAGALGEPGWRIEQPTDFRRGEVRVDDKAGTLGDPLAETRGAPGFAQFGGAPVLPDDGVMDRAAGGAVP